MFDDVERRYLLKLARDLRRQGLSAEDTRKTIRAKIGAFTCENRINCVISHVFGNGST